MTLIANPPKLYPFQEEGVAWLESLERGGILADDMGMGKTAQIIRAARRKGLRRVLIVTLTSVVPVWEQEIEKWAPGTTCEAVSAKQDADERVRTIRGTQVFTVIGYDLMRKLAIALSMRKWDLVVFDEAHRLKNRKTIAHKKARLLMRKSATDRIWFATGTPVQNHTEDYWPLLRAIADGFGSYWEYANKYCDVSPVIHPRTKQVLGMDVKSIEDADDPRVKALTSRISKFFLRRTKKDTLDLPDKTQVSIPVELSPIYRRMYREMEDKFMVRLPTGDIVTADTVLAQTTRLLQLCVDWQLLVPQEPGWAYAGPKEQALMELVDQLQGRQFVLFSQWANVIDLIYNLLAGEDITCSVFTGRNLATRQTGLEFWKGGHTQGLLVTLGAGGTGLDFTEASEAFFLDRSWNPKVNEQAEDRLYRHGQRNAVTIYNLFCTGTVEDDRVFPTLERKEKLADALVESLAES